MTDHLKGAWVRFKGDLKQRWGKLIGDEMQQIEGSYEKVIGMLQERYGGNCIRLVQERYGARQSTNSYDGPASGSGGLTRKARKIRNAGRK